MKKKQLSLKVKKRSKSKLSSLFFFKHDLQFLKYLNEELSQSVKKMIKIELKEIGKEIKKSDKEVKKELKMFIDFLDELLKILKTDKKRLGFSKKITIKNPKVEKLILKILKPFSLGEESIRFIRDMSLIYLISSFEGFLLRVFTNVISNDPRILKSKEKKITYEEILSYKNLNQIRKMIMYKEINDIINGGIDNIDSYLQKTFKLNLSRKKDWRKFRERFYRRNVIIHNRGIVNEFYRKKTNYKGKKRKLIVSKKYMKDSIDLFDKFSKIIYNHFKSKQTRNQYRI